MALVIVCPCGLPLDCENIDLVITASCPRCKRELSLDVESGNAKTRRAVLTLMDGPIWRGEQFVMPVGQQLTIGTGTETWLSLEGEGIEPQHCRLRVSGNGYVVIEDLDTPDGTWIENARIAKGKLLPAHSFRIGEYRFRLDFRSSLGPSRPTSVGGDEIDNPIPASTVFDRWHKEHSPAAALVQQRFGFARIVLTIYAWLAGVYHFLYLHQQAEPRWEGYLALIAGVIIVTALLLTTRLVALVHRHAKYAGILALLVLAVFDLANLRLNVPAIPSIVLAAAMALGITRTPGPVGVVTAAFFAVGAVGMMAIVLLQVAIPLLPI